MAPLMWHQAETTNSAMISGMPMTAPITVKISSQLTRYSTQNDRLKLKAPAAARRALGSFFIRSQTSSGPSRLSEPALSSAAIGADRWARTAAMRLLAGGTASAEAPE